MFKSTSLKRQKNHLLSLFLQKQEMRLSIHKTGLTKQTFCLFHSCHLRTAEILFSSEKELQSSVTEPALPPSWLRATRRAFSWQGSVCSSPAAGCSWSSSWGRSFLCVPSRLGLQPPGTPAGAGRPGAPGWGGLWQTGSPAAPGTHSCSHSAVKRNVSKPTIPPFYHLPA